MATTTLSSSIVNLVSTWISLSLKGHGSCMMLYATIWFLLNVFNTFASTQSPIHCGCDGTSLSTARQVCIGACTTVTPLNSSREQPSTGRVYTVIPSSTSTFCQFESAIPFNGNRITRAGKTYINFRNIFIVSPVHIRKYKKLSVYFTGSHTFAWVPTIRSSGVTIPFKYFESSFDMAIMDKLGGAPGETGNILASHTYRFSNSVCNFLLTCFPISIVPPGCPPAHLSWEILDYFAPALTIISMATSTPRCILR